MLLCLHLYMQASNEGEGLEGGDYEGGADSDAYGYDDGEDYPREDDEGGLEKCDGRDADYPHMDSEGVLFSGLLVLELCLP